MWADKWPYPRWSRKDFNQDHRDKNTHKSKRMPFRNLEDLLEQYNFIGFHDVCNYSPFGMWLNSSLNLFCRLFYLGI